MSITYGRVPKPAFEKRDIPSTGTGRNAAWNDLGQRVPKFVVLHRMYGSLDGTDEWFRTWSYVDSSGVTRKGGAQLGLTDYGLDARSGKAYRWNDPWGRRAPWASGPYEGPSGDAPQLVKVIGVDGINRDGVSIEVSGDGDDPVSEVAYQKIIALVAWHADQAQVPYTAFPMNPATGKPFVMHHGEFYAGKRDTCPGPVIAAATDRIIADAMTLLEKHQTGGTVTTPTTPEKPEPGVLGIPYSKLFGKEYDPNGTVSKLWRENGAKTGKYPRLVSFNTAAGYFQFGDGSVIQRAKDGTVSYIGPAKG